MKMRGGCVCVCVLWLKIFFLGVYLGWGCVSGLGVVRGQIFSHLLAGLDAAGRGSSMMG